MLRYRKIKMSSENEQLNGKVFARAVIDQTIVIDQLAAQAHRRMTQLHSMMDDTQQKHSRGNDYHNYLLIFQKNATLFGDCLYICNRLFNQQLLKTRTDTYIQQPKNQIKIINHLTTKTMKYKLLRFSLLSMLVMFFGGLANAEEVSIDFTSTSEYAAMGFTLPEAGKSTAITEAFTYKGITITPYAGTQALSIYNSSGKYTLRYYKPKDGNYGGFKVEVEGCIITQVVITGNSELVNTIVDDEVGSITMSNSNKTLTWTSTDGEESVTFRNNGEGKTINVETLTVTYQAGGTVDERTATTMTFEPETVDVEITEGNTFPLPTAKVSYADGTVSDPAITWTSSNESAATINGTNINAVAPGTATITATYEGDDTYKGCSASFKVAVNPDKLTITSLKDLQEQVTSTETPVTLTLTNVQVTALKGTSNAYLCDADGYGALLYTKNHGLTAGQVLNGTIDVKFMLYKGATEITNFTTEGLTITEAELTPTEKTLDAISLANQSMLVTVKGVTYNATDKTFSDGTNTIAYYDNFGVSPTLDDGKKYDVTGIVVQYNNLQLCPRTADDVVEATETIEIPENALWYSNEAVDINWGDSKIDIDAEKLANLQIGDVIHVAVESAQGTGIWDAQVAPFTSNWTQLENGVPVGGGSVADAAFVITGDMLKLIQANGLLITGAGYSTKLITLETGVYSGSENSVWLGDATLTWTQAYIQKQHFINTDVQAGEILKFSYEATGNPNIQLVYNWEGGSYGSPEYNDGFATLTVTEDMIAHMKESGVIVNADGIRLTQVELLPPAQEEKHLYLIGVDVWDLSSIPEMTYNAETKAFEKEISYDSNIYFAISDVASAESWDEFGSHRYAIGSGDVVPTLGETVQLEVFVGGTIQLPPGTYKISVTEDMKMTITGEIATVEDADYIVAGTPASIFGTTWDATNEDNKMTKQDDGTYAITYTAVAPQDNIEFKVVKNGSEWIGKDGNNVSFNVTSECDVTITINPETNEITVSGNGVAFATELEYEKVFAVGNGEGTWLNGITWNPGAAENEMTQVSDDVWEITFTDVPAGFSRQVKFVIDGDVYDWAKNFGGTFADFGVETDAVWNAGNITFDTTEETQDITIRLDLTNFDFETKTGAKFTISLGSGEEPPVEEEGEMIKWGEDDVAAAGETEKSYSTESGSLTLTIVDDNSKLKITANNCWFGDAEKQVKFTHRLQTGGKSTSKNSLTLTCASAGTLKIYVRTGSNDATDRNLVVTQGENELYNEIVQESDAIKVKGLDAADPEKETNVYPIISVEVEAGDVVLGYPVNSLNFYAFEFIPAEEIVDSIKAVEVNRAFDENAPAYNLAGQRVDKSYRGVVIQKGRKFILK